jgi:prepilin-type N-terminal cleavage/methylation domain-containing protein
MKRRPAFTLIEILIVIFIMAILTVVVIANYGVARQKAKADLIADELINTIKEQQNSAKTGKGAVPQCYGVYFNMSNDQAEVQTVTAPYKSVDEFSADYCDTADSVNVHYQKFTDMENFTLDGINAFDSSESFSDVSYLLMFKPPEASVVGGSGLDVPPEPLNSKDNSLFEVKFKSMDGIEKRIISFDIATGRAQKSTVSPAGAQ